MSVRMASLLTLVLALLAQPAVAVDLAQAERIMHAGRFVEAWDLLVPHEFEHAGNQEYDYLLGVAALEAGHPGRATLAFERVLTVNPNHAAARLDMGRALFALGDFERARSEFETVRRFEPPPPAQAVIDRYLAVIAARGQAAKQRVSAYAEAGFGKDSNITTAPAAASYYLPVFRADVPAPSRRPDTHFTAGVGGELTQLLGNGLDGVLGFDIRQRGHRQVDIYDFRNLALRLGMVKSAEHDQYRLFLSHDDYDLDNQRYRRTSTLTGEWRHQFAPDTQASLFVQQQRARYLTAQSHSGDQMTTGIGATHLLDPATGTFVFGNVYVGTEIATDGRIDGDKSIAGGKFGVQRRLRGDLDAFVSIGILSSRYNLHNVLFADRRQEFQYDLAIGATWRFAPDWSLKPQLAYLRNDANFGIYDYVRRDLSVMLRRDFR